MKKKMIFFTILFLFLTSFGQTIYAEESVKNVFIGEERLRIAFPGDCYIYQKEVDENDPYMIEAGANKDYMEAFYEENQIFAHCVDPEDKFEIVCSKKRSDTYQYLGELSMLSDTDVISLARSIASAYEEYGYVVSGIGNYSTNGEKFAVILFETQGEEGKVTCKQYVTVRRKKTYYFTLRCFTEDALDNYPSLMEDVISSISFYRLGPDNSVAYTNHTYGISYLIPEGWGSDGTEKTKSYLQAQYIHNSMLGETFQFYAYDVWGNMDILRKITNTRGELDTQLGGKSIQDNKSYLSSFFQNFENVQMMEYGDAKLLYEDTPYLVEHDEIQGNYFQQNFCMLKQGILYLFQYGYYEGNNIHEDEVKEWLETLAFSDAEILANDKAAYEEIAHLSQIAIIVIAVLVITLFAFAFVYIYIHLKHTSKESDTER